MQGSKSKRQKKSWDLPFLTSSYSEGSLEILERLILNIWIFGVGSCANVWVSFLKGKFSHTRKVSLLTKIQVILLIPDRIAIQTSLVQEDFS